MIQKFLCVFVIIIAGQLGGAIAAAHRPAVSVTQRMAHETAGSWCWAVFPTDPYKYRCADYGLSNDYHSTDEHRVVWHRGFARNNCGRLYYPLNIVVRYADHGGSYVSHAPLASHGSC